jgi:hypothetical protein
MYRLGTNKCKRVGLAPKRLLFGFNVIVSQSEYYTENRGYESSPNFVSFPPYAIQVLLFVTLIGLMQFFKQLKLHSFRHCRLEGI